MPVACFSDDSFCTPEGVCHILGVDMPIRKVLPNKTVRILSCLQRHLKKGPKLKQGLHEFSKVAIMWDGRPIQTTQFSDNTIRKELEASLINAFNNFGKFKSVNASSSGSRANLHQKETIKHFREELFFILYKFGYLKEIPREKQESRELTNEETTNLLTANGFYVIERKGKWITCTNDRTVYSVSASPKKWGWQITVRDDLMKWFESGNDGLYLLLQRTKPYLIPSSFLRRFVLENRVQNTIDLYVDDQKDCLKCGKQNDIDIKKYSLSWTS